jgi:farnesyl diphosphate synthase
MVRLQQNPLPLKNNSFLEKLQGVALEVEHILETLLPSPTTRLHEAMRYSVLGGGKRLRSFLVWESSQLFGVPPVQALKVAAAVELIQAYSLVHDDLPCMDNGDMRRGKPSCHKAFGEATATLVGDALIPLAFQVLSRLEASAEVRLELIDKLSETIGSQGLVAGQMMDLGQEHPRRTLEDLLEQEYLKTGVFFGFSAEAGAILGNASVDERKALRSYGLLLGEGFQMMDDFLDGHGTLEILGKPCGQDGTKLTFLSLLGSDELYKRVESILHQAMETLSPFGEKASLLKDIVHFVLTRK